MPTNEPPKYLDRKIFYYRTVFILCLSKSQPILGRGWLLPKVVFVHLGLQFYVRSSATSRKVAGFDSK
jgi:hypothetical protein